MDLSGRFCTLSRLEHEFSHFTRLFSEVFAGSSLSGFLFFRGKVFALGIRGLRTLRNSLFASLHNFHTTAQHVRSLLSSWFYSVASRNT